MSFEVRCPACHRVETWDAEPEPHRVEVRLEGGSRRPIDPLPLAAWTTLAGTLRSPRQQAFGPCPACGQPLVAHTTEVAPRAYRLELEGPHLDFDAERFTGPEGEMTPEEARRFVRQHLPPGEAGGTRLAFASVAAGFALLIATCWLFALAFFVFFVFYGAATGQVFDMRW